MDSELQKPVRDADGTVLSIVRHLALQIWCEDGMGGSGSWREEGGREAHSVRETKSDLV